MYNFSLLFVPSTITYIIIYSIIFYKSPNTLSYIYLLVTVKYFQRKEMETKTKSLGNKIFRHYYLSNCVSLMFTFSLLKQKFVEFYPDAAQ